MDYGSLIRDSWNLTWRYRFLWLLGILAGGAVGMPRGGDNVTWQANRSDLRQLPPEVAREMEAISGWVVANAALLIAVAALVVLAALVLLVLSFVAQGAMARATAELATGQGTSLGAAWREGLHFFWRYVGMWALLVAAGILVALVVGGVVALAVGAGLFAVNLAEVPAVLTVALVAIVAIPFAIAAVVAGIGVTIVVAYAQRAIAVEDVGPVRALTDAWNLFRGHLGTSLLVWLVNVALSIGVGIAIGAVVVVLLAVLGGLGFLVWSAVGLTAGTVSYGVLAGILFFAGLLLFLGVANTFFWNYWTIAYLRLSGQTPSPVVV